MADDLGYGDIGCYGAKPKNLKTPHIDKLAANGLRFTSGYCSASTCTPTRFSFLTGKYAFRQAGTGIAPPNGPAVIKPGPETLPSLLKKAGYKTAVIGKWHLNTTPQGFDYWEVLPGQGSYYNPVFIQQDNSRKRFEGYVTDITTDKAIAWHCENAKEEVRTKMRHDFNEMRANGEANVSGVRSS